MRCRKRLPLGAAVLCTGVCAGPARAQDVAALDEVNVRGGTGPPTRGPKDATVAASVVTRDELAAPGVRAADVLRGQVGVQVSESGGVGAPATASIRGATASQVPVYLAGVCLNDDIVGAADLSQIPLRLVDRVEVYRGDAPLEADRLGIGGAIFFEPRWPRGTQAEVAGMLGSFGARGASGFVSAGNREAAVLAGASADAATNDYPFVNDHGTLLAPTGSSIAHMSNADAATYDAWLLGRAHLGHGVVIDAFANGTTREQGVPTLALVPSREARASFARVLGGARALVPLDAAGAVSLEARTSVSLARAVYRDPLDELTLLANRLELDGARVGERVVLRVAAGESLEVRAAADVSSETLGRDADGHPELRAHRMSSRIATAARQWIGDAFSVQVLAAGQCDGTSMTALSTCDTFTPVGRAGIAWTQATWDAYANVGRYVRVPTLGELYGMSPIVRGNATLVPESGVSADAGVRWATRSEGDRRAAWATLGAFVRWTSELVSFERSSQGYVEPFNLASARVAGVEAQAGAGFLRWFAADVTATVLDPRNTTADRLTVNDVLPFQSRLVVVPRLSAEVRGLRLGPLGRARAEARLVHQSSRYADVAGLAVIPEQTSLDAEVLAQSPDLVFTARLRATDLTDAARFDIVGFPLPGRSLFLSLEATW